MMIATEVKLAGREEAGPPGRVRRSVTEPSFPSKGHGKGKRPSPLDVWRPWDHADFLSRVKAARATGDKDTIKQVLVEVAEHNYLLREQWPTPKTILVTHQQCIEFGMGASLPRQKTVWTFANWDTIKAMQHFCRLTDGLRVVCGLNFANGEHVGGGYKKGAMAQEEELCRQMPTLYSSLFGAQKYGGCYPFGPSTCKSLRWPERFSDVLYTPDLVIARGTEDQGYQILEEAEQVRVSLVSAAAPNINFRGEIMDQQLVYKTIQSILVTPKMRNPGVTTLVLGAWGCGAFGGDPNVYAELFLKALVDDGLGSLYRDIHIAIPKSGNADVFLNAFINKGVPLTLIDKRVAIV